MTKRKHNTEWSAAEVSRVRNMAILGKSSREVAKAIGRTPGAVKYKAMVCGISFHKITQPKGVQRRLGRKRAKFGMKATLETRVA